MLPSRLRERVASLTQAYREQVRGRGYLAGFDTYPAPGGVGYVGSSRCARCHPGIYEEWLRTAHSGALATLEAAARRGTRSACGATWWGSSA